MKALHRWLAVFGIVLVALVGIAIDEPVRAWMHEVGRMLRALVS